MYHLIFWGILFSAFCIWMLVFTVLMIQRIHYEDAHIGYASSRMAPYILVLGLVISMNTSKYLNVVKVQNCEDTTVVQKQLDYNRDIPYTVIVECKDLEDSVKYVSAKVRRDLYDNLEINQGIDLRNVDYRYIDVLSERLE